MKLSYDLNLEQSQNLIMTPELRQAIELLQFNSMELNEYITKELEENPMLEREKAKDEFEDIEEYRDDKEIDWKEYVEKYDDHSYRPERDKNAKQINFDSFLSSSITLREHLMTQLKMIDLDSGERKIGEYIVNNIDKNGYFEIEGEEVSNLLGVKIEDVEKVLQLVQGFDPTGVGARDLRECLLIQIKSRPKFNKYARIIIENYLYDLGSNKIQKIAKELNLSAKEVQEACDYIKKLEPKPGRSFGDEDDSIRYIKADAEIKLMEGKYVVVVNESTAPRLNINNYYRNLMKKGKDESAVEYLNQKFNSAMWIIKSIEQRKNTIKNVVESILKFQMDFFLQGEKALKPLTLKEIAEDIDMHESTISRTTNGKYVQTPRGLYELKYFFRAGLESSDGDMSSTSIKSRIKELIEKEDKKKPYSDQKISDLLKEEGIKISRRTVAKYRDELNIASSSLRRRY